MEKKARRARTKNLKSKYVKTNARVLHVLNQDHGVEQSLFKNIEEYWANKKRVLRAMIFRKVLSIDP